MTTALERGEWSATRPDRTLPPGNTRYPFYRRLGGPQGRSGGAENLIPTGIRSRTVHSVVSPYSDWATRPTCTCIIFLKYSYLQSSWQISTSHKALHPPFGQGPALGCSCKIGCHHPHTLRCLAKGCFDSKKNSLRGDNLLQEYWHSKASPWPWNRGSWEEKERRRFWYKFNKLSTATTRPQQFTAFFKGLYCFNV